ncbi:MAG: hypothetical protein ACLPPF_12855 [Rhodomicrobium sp.]
MDDPRNAPGMNDAPQGELITAVQKMDFPEGTGYGFSLLDEATKAPCFKLVFETAADAEQGRAMMSEIMEHALWFEVPDAPQADAPR